MVLAGLLHDVGNICAMNGATMRSMGLDAADVDEYGIKDHEKIGENYLRKFGK